MCLWVVWQLPHINEFRLRNPTLDGKLNIFTKVEKKMRKHAPKIWPYHCLKIDVISQHYQMSPTINILHPHFKKIQGDITTCYGQQTCTNRFRFSNDSVSIPLFWIELNWISPKKLTGKLKNLSEIIWFVWVFNLFWLVLCCVAWRLFTIEKMP